MKKKIFSDFINKEHGQMITLMGITLTLSVVVIGAISAEVADMDKTIPQGRKNNLISEFMHLKKAFGTALNYNIVDIDYISIDEVKFPGDLYGPSVRYPDIGNVVDETSKSFRGIELMHDMIFTATYESLDYSHLSPEGHVYYARVKLSLKDSTGLIVEPVIYSILVKEPTYP